MQAHTLRWIHAATLSFLLAVGLGIFMGASHDHSLAAVHVHLNLLGWVSMALIGVVYHLAGAGNGRLATVQFWLHCGALAVMMVALGAVMKGHAALEPVLGLSSLAMGVAVLLFAVNLLRARRATAH